jgi:YD repeat-containing protein
MRTAASVSDGTNSAAYTYLANSSLVGQIAFQHSGATQMTTAQQYDNFHPVRYGKHKPAFRRRCESRWLRPVAQWCAQLSHGVNRLTSISSTGGALSAGPMSFNYAYNLGNQRTQTTLVDGSHWAYQYDALGQVIAGGKYWFDGGRKLTRVIGRQGNWRKAPAREPIRWNTLTITAGDCR